MLIINSWRELEVSILVNIPLLGIALLFGWWIAGRK